MWCLISAAAIVLEKKALVREEVIEGMDRMPTTVIPHLYTYAAATSLVCLYISGLGSWSEYSIIKYFCIRFSAEMNLGVPCIGVPLEGERVPRKSTLLLVCSSKIKLLLGFHNTSRGYVSLYLTLEYCLLQAKLCVCTCVRSTL